MLEQRSLQKRKAGYNNYLTEDLEKMRDTLVPFGYWSVFDNFVLNTARKKISEDTEKTYTLLSCQRDIAYRILKILENEE
ncbi:MAG: hypothetical protein VW518_10140 [Burkholderiaceae bacterium]